MNRFIYLQETDMPGPHTILVVEDNSDAQYLVCEMLRAMGHTACGANDAEQALGMLAGQHFAILFTDISLPGMSGIELAKKATADDPDLKIIFASGFGSNVSDYVDFPAVSLPKPYDMLQLQAILDGF